MLKQPKIIPIGTRKYVVPEDYTWDNITVPKGFQHDGASVPRAVWTISGITPDGLHRAGALIHDWIYRKGGNKSWLYKNDFTRQQADKIFLTIMIAAGMGWKAKVIYWAVRLFGKFAWKKEKK